MSLPVVAALVAWATNWIAVQMLFYPIESVGPEYYRAKFSPYGLLCWQGVVPTKAEMMAARLTDIVTKRLLRLPEAFGRLDASRFASLLQPSIEEAIRRDAPNGQLWAFVMKPFLGLALARVVKALQLEIEAVLDVNEVVTSAFLRDKEVLVDLFRKVGRVELEFLIHSGFVFGFILGLLQMFLWGLFPKFWTLPLAGAFLGYVTNWIAIKLVFDPVEPIQIGPFVLQGLFEKRQPEVSDEFSEFLASRVLTSPRLVNELVNGNMRCQFEDLLRRNVPFVVPDSVVNAALGGLRDLALEPATHPAHAYMAERLEIQETLAHRLKLLSPADFENLLHPVFQEDEFTLIFVGGVLGFGTGTLQYIFNLGGPAGVSRKLALAAVR